MTDIEPLLAYLRAQRDAALEASDRAHLTTASLEWWHGGRMAAYERAIVAVARWAEGKDPDPGSPRGGT